MTLGDFVMYIFFIGLLAAPMISIASIGTQITEAFAGLDRIREIMNMQTEDEADDGKASLGEIRGDIRFEDVWFEYNPGQPVLKGVTFHAAPGHDDGARRIERLGQEHADQPGDGVQPAAQGPHPRRRQGPGGRFRCATTASSWRRCCRRTSCSTARSPTTSATRSPASTLDEIKHAAQVAHCEEFILKFPEGYDTIVGERGIKLSRRSAPARLDRARDPGRAARC